MLQAQRHRVADQLAEQAPAPGEVADCLAGLLVDARGDEPLQLGTAGVEDAQRRVAGPGQLARHLEHSQQNGLGVEFGNQPAARLDKPPQAPFVQVLVCHIHEGPVTTLDHLGKRPATNRPSGVDV